MTTHIDQQNCRELSVESDKYPLVIDRRSRAFGVDFGLVIAIRLAGDIIRSHGLNTRLPVPVLVEATISLRGMLIPVVDLRACMGMPQPPRTIKSRVAIAISAGKFLAMVLHDDDRLKPVEANLNAALSQPPEDNNGDYLKVVVRDGRMIVLLGISQSESALALSVFKNVSAAVRRTVVSVNTSN